MNDSMKAGGCENDSQVNVLSRHAENRKQKGFNEDELCRQNFYRYVY